MRSPELDWIHLDLFRFNDYVEYLAALSEAQVRRGFASAFAKAIGTRPSYVSQVLAGKLNLSLEQGDRASAFLKHSKSYRNYFLLLICHKRAGTDSLKQYWFDALDKARNIAPK